MIGPFMTKSSTKMGHKIGLAISLLVSLGIAGYLFAKLDWPEVWLQLQQVNPWIIPILLVGFTPLFWMRAMRWRLLLPNRESLSVSRLTEATIIGFFASFVLPLRAGEIIRPWVLSLADSVCLLSLLLICLTQLSEVPVVIVAGAQALTLLTVILIGIIIVSYLLPGKMEGIFHWFSDRIVGRFAPHLAQKANQMITDYFSGLRVITSIWQLVGVILWSYAMWLMVAIWYQGLLWAFGIYPSLWVGMMLNVMVALAVAAPSAPGFLGTFQVGCILALSTVYGYSKEFAMAYSVIGHLLQMVFNIGAGLIVLQLRGLKFRQLRDAD